MWRESLFDISARKRLFGFADARLFLEESSLEDGSVSSDWPHHRELSQLYTLLKFYFVLLDFDIGLELESANAMECRQGHLCNGFARSIVFSGAWISLLWFQFLNQTGDKNATLEKLTFIGIWDSYNMRIILLVTSSAENSAHGLWKSARNKRNCKCGFLSSLRHHIRVFLIVGRHWS